MARLSAKPLVVEVRSAGSAAVVRLTGSAGINEAERLQAELQGIAERAAGPIVVDLTDLDFICSAGLGALLVAHAKTSQKPGCIRLVHPQPFVFNILQTTQLTRLFPIFTSLDDALGPIGS